MFTDASLDAGLLIGTNHECVFLQWLALPLAGIQIQNASGLGSEVRIAREYPSALVPGTDGVLTEPAPHRLVADGGYDA